MGRKLKYSDMQLVEALDLSCSISGAAKRLQLKPTSLNTFYQRARKSAPVRIALASAARRGAPKGGDK